MTTANADAATVFAARNREAANRLAVRMWLYVVVLALLALVLVGGATRLTDSGLSITEWKPIHGVVPPLNEAEWEEELAKYRLIPEYQQINKGMSLDEFKRIFWWEWAHRLLARGIGVIFAIPLIWFWATGRLERALKPRLTAILALGGLQGAVGWWMVASGLTERTDVSQYRLAVHLTLACVIIAAIVWVARGLAIHTAGTPPHPVGRFAGWMALAVLLQIFLGALVAGLDAGMAYNTWPLMDGAVVPGGLFVQQPAWINLFENPKTVQFVHRSFAYVVLALALWHALSAARAAPQTPHAARALILFGLLLVQAGIGVATLLSQVEFNSALAHQGFAVFVLIFAMAHWRGTVGPYPLPTDVMVRT